MKKHKFNIKPTINESIDDKEVSKDLKRQMRFTIISIFFVTIIMISSSYAIFSDVQRQQTNNTLTVGKLKIDFVDTEAGMGNIINLNGTYPTSDADGLTTAPYIFKITNSGSLDAKYKVKIIDDTNVINEDGCSNNLLPKNRIRVSVNGGTPFTLSEKESIDYVVEEGKLLKNASKNFQIRIWISSESGNEVLGKHYHGKIVVDSEHLVANSNILKAYTYNQTSEASNYCITGEEATCEETTCYKNRSNNSCPAGTIIKYKVNNNTTETFHVMYDSANSLTMQTQKNTVYNTAWISKEDYIAAGGTEEDYGDNGKNNKGPLTILSALENATSGWTNVEDQTYTMGTTNFPIGDEGQFPSANSGTSCTNTSCSGNKYTLDSRTAKSRMITIQETSMLGCTSSIQSCPVWMNNFLVSSTDYGGTVNDNPNIDNKGYWTMSAYSSNSSAARLVYMSGCAHYRNAGDTTRGARAVVVVNK